MLRMPSNSRTQGSGQIARQSTADSSWKWRLLRAAGRCLAAYLVVVLMFGFLQRSLIYLPTRQAPIEPRDAGLPRGQVHAVTVRAQDQVELHGWHILADGHSAASRVECDRELASGRRLVLFFSGNAGNRCYRPPEFSILTRLGVDVFIFDYRGYGDNLGSPTEALLTSDARTIWNYATQDRDVSPDRIILYGESLGGAVAIRLAAELSKTDVLPAGLIVRSTFSSLVEAGEYHYPWLPVRLALVDRFDSLGRIAEVECPILQLHGTRDTIMPIELGQRLFAAAPERSTTGIAKRFVKLRNANHNDVTDVAAAELSEAIDEFLGQLDR
jgi:pimeloyl-ACP methyl ester carboxylesterase